MRPLPLPQVQTSHVLALCIAGTKDAGLQIRIGRIAGELSSAEASYDALAKTQMLHLIARVSMIGAVTKDELTQLYSDHLSATSGAARHVYDSIRNAVPNKKCPLCGVGTVAVLDHHLPKSKYPNFSITPANLIPACHHCNDRKRAKYPRSANEQTLHPYYDGYLSGQWLYAQLDRVSPLVILYTVRPPGDWSDVDRCRVQRHFEVCSLATTFTSNANDDLSLLKDYLARLYSGGGAGTVRAFLDEQALIHSARKNSWQFAMYQALSLDAWFIDGGFKAIA